MTAELATPPQRDKSPLTVRGCTVPVRGILRQYAPGFACAATLGAASALMAAPWRLPGTVAGLLTVAATTFAVVAGFLAVVTMFSAVTEVTTTLAQRRAAAESVELSPVVSPGRRSTPQSVSGSGRR